MVSYDVFAKYYDRPADSYAPTIDRVTGYIARYLPSATSLLELGCGTGTLLAAMAANMDLTGVDLSSGMLAVARGKVPSARLMKGDMTSVRLDRTFDVVICSDAINHLLDFRQWVELFDRAHGHLTEHGLFLFDVNTIGSLRRMCRNPTHVRTVGRDVLIIDVTLGGEDIATWDVQIFEHIGQNLFRLHREKMSEIGPPITRIRGALAKNFKVLAEEDADGGSVTDESRWVFFACRKAA